MSVTMTTMTMVMTLAMTAGCAVLHLPGVPVDTEAEAEAEATVAKRTDRPWEQGLRNVRKDGSGIRFYGQRSGVEAADPLTS